jgi:hypothetical protein
VDKDAVRRRALASAGGRRTLLARWQQLSALLRSPLFCLGELRARSHCRFAPPLIHFITYSRMYSVPLLLKRQCDRAPGELRRWPFMAALARQLLLLHHQLAAFEVDPRRLPALLRDHEPEPEGKIHRVDPKFAS